MGGIKFDYTNALDFVAQHEIDSIQDDVKLQHEKLHSANGAGNEYLGWVDLPVNLDDREINRIKAVAQRIRLNSDAVVVLGIGGSYLGAKAAIKMLSHTFHNNISKERRGGNPEIYFAGNQLSTKYIQDLLDVLEDKQISIIIISKSGMTLETAIASRIFRSFMEKKYGRENAAKRIYVITDGQKGALKKLADEEGYESFVLPADVGGRYSVLTVVGLLPIAISGADIDSILQGAQDAHKQYLTPSLENNECYQYAAIRNVLYKKGKTVEILANYEPSLHYFAEWWKQLFGESEGKDFKGILPVSVDFTTDLHSMGQYIQQGLRNIFETVVFIEKNTSDFVLEKTPDNVDGLNYLADKQLHFVNTKAFQGTTLAHADGGVPNLIVTLPESSEYFFGNMVYFFEKACGLSGYLLGVNPFNQPGVENYKKNMIALLGAPGFERERQALEERLGD